MSEQSMSEKTQIKEMARDICLLPCACDHCQVQLTKDGKCQARIYAERAYIKGWRKPPKTDR